MRRTDGEVDCPGYLEDADARALLASLPFEHLAYEAGRASAKRLQPRLINRLRRERLQFEQLPAPPALLFVLPGQVGPAAQVWTLQSWPGAVAVNAAEGPARVRELAKAADFVFFARGVDLIHPSAAGVVARQDGADAVLWNRFSADFARGGSGGVVYRRPPFDPVTARHGALTDTCLALRGAVLADAPDDVLAALSQGRLHPLWFWLAGQALAWRLHPEALTSDVGEPFTLDGPQVEQDDAVYRSILEAEGGRFALDGPSRARPFPYVLQPDRRAKATSVLVCFRDKAGLTLGCLESLAGQRLSGALQVVLVDNGSAPEETRAVLDGARRLFGEAAVDLIRYDRPFNHSAQNNLAAQAARGEVVVFCNNDVILNEDGLLEQLTAWALQPGVGAVGCRMHDPARDVGSYGHVASAPSADPFRPALGENRDPTYGWGVHASPGVTLAFAAMARERFLAVGGLDESRFPIGYNDMDLMLRAADAGLTHLYLGHLSAEHPRGATRTGDDEGLQALWVNERHPSSAFAHIRQLARERVDVAVRPVVAAPGPAALAPAARQGPLHGLLLAGARLRRKLFGRSAPKR